jgi:uncharacterized membrane protein YcaP (DUF421 family)
MDDLFVLSAPWWHFVLRAVAIYAMVMVMIRVSGKRAVGQFTPFDLLVVMLLSEAVSNSLSGKDNSLLGGLLLACTLIALNFVLAFVASRSPRLERWVEGSAVLIGRDGEFFDAVVRKHRLGRGELEQALRAADCRQEDMQCAFLETDGEISILKKR